MKKVAREYLRQIPDSNVYQRMVELECGHTKRDPFEVYGNETAVAIKEVAHKLDPTIERKCRCYKCGQ